MHTYIYVHLYVLMYMLSVICKAILYCVFIALSIFIADVYTYMSNMCGCKKWLILASYAVCEYKCVHTIHYTYIIISIFLLVRANTDIVAAIPIISGV